MWLEQKRIHGEATVRKKQSKATKALLESKIYALGWRPLYAAVWKNH